ncbi:flagellar basal body P-ring formation chaperone FlgA [Pseudomonas sp. Gutcm_11s]|uniref:flagellar basal body P-ring formation chaperone FlgA n=1 Tax=Pseudomonas sp. Gutcm_11s TaxID=3026088 RepID=UPI00235E279F|nr:flagellar basal body P-ring formation chaperone FlgA [Pseudomonas sp. Gutcm_11s]MDD0842011.1 flagellar basal body P-ring formation chaperone FlgA [Pseudomonas sp. Gutcm_11s]
MGNLASLFRVSRRARGSAVSALLLGGVLLSAEAAETAQQQLEDAVAAPMRDLLESHARTQGWQGMEYHLQQQLLGNAPAAPCPQAPSVERVAGDPDPLQRQRFQLRCAQAGWQATLLSQAQVYLPMVVALRVVERDQTIAAADLRLERTDLGKARRGFFNSIEQVVGQSAKRRLRAGQLINPSLLDVALLVRRGDKVKIVASQDGIQASANGEALADGKQGEVIRVRNLSSEKVIDAQVLESGVVSSILR